MEFDKQSLLKYLPLVAVAGLVAVAIRQLSQRRKPRSFREDPIGAVKDHSEILANRAQEATEEALSRLQESLDELRGRLPEVNRKQLNKRRKEINKRINDLSEQAQALLKELRASSTSTAKSWFAK